MIFNGKCDENLQFKSICKTKQFEWNYDCLRKSANDMFTQISAKKGIKSCKGCTVAAILKEYTQLDDINVAGPGKPDVITP